MSINTKLDMSLGGQLGRRGEIDEKPLSTPIDELRYGERLCIFS
jgi:hypothetical protein